MSRENQYLITLTVDGEDFGIWDKTGGGAADSEEQKYQPGGGQPMLSLGGRQTVENVTVSKIFTDAIRLKLPALLQKRGNGQAVVIKQSTDGSYVPNGKPLIYKGVLKAATPPDADSESSDAGLIEVEISSASVSMES